MKSATPFHLEIMPPPQRRLWAELRALPECFTLYGGTAIALQLGHRVSVDFDMFSRETFNPQALLESLPFLAGARVEQMEPSTLTVSVDRDGPVKLSFFGAPRIRPLRAPVADPETGVKVAALLDLGGLKASVVTVRAEAKDYLDIDALIGSGAVDLPTMLGAALAHYGERYAPQTTLKALSFYDDGDLAAVPEVVRRRLADAVRAIDLDRLPRIAPFQQDVGPR